MLSLIFDSLFTLYSDMHNHNTVASFRGKLFKPPLQTYLYGKNSIIISAVNAWNEIQTAFGDVILENVITIETKIIIIIIIIIITIFPIISDLSIYFQYNHTIDCNRHCTVNGVDL